MTELKRCPFCGGEPELNTDEVKYLRCSKCWTMQDYQPSVSAAKKLWNTRPIEDELNARIKELEEELK
jgi:Lar family restriction alleviation protein